MQPEEKHQPVPQKKTKTRIFRFALVIVVVFIVSAFFLVPVFVSSEKVRKTILAKINTIIVGEVNFASLSMSWFKGIRVTEVGFSDRAGQTSVKAGQITTKPHYVSILMGNLSFGKTIIDQPKVQINLKRSQTADVQGTHRQAAADKKAQPPVLPVEKIDLIINDGSLKITDSQADTIEMVGINSKLTLNLTGDSPLEQTEQLLANLDAKVEFGFERAEYLGLNFGPAETHIRIQKGLLDITPFSISVNNGQLSFAGQADLTRRAALLKTAGPLDMVKNVQISDETTGKLLMYVNPIFANAVNVSGIANFSCESLAVPLVRADKNDLEIIGTISISNLHLQPTDLLGRILAVAGTDAAGQEITIRPTRFVLQNGLLRYDDMQMDIGDNPINFKGVIGLDNTLDMTVTLPYTLKGRTARVDKKTVGRRISLPLKGTIDKPELDVGRMLEEQLTEELMEKVKEELGEGLGEELGEELGEKALELLGELLK